MNDFTCNSFFLGVGDTLYRSLTKYGFVYMLGHGVPDKQVEDVFKVSKEFFDLPLETKEASFPREESSQVISMKLLQCLVPTILTLQGYVKPGLELLDQLKEEDGPKVRDPGTLFKSCGYKKNYSRQCTSSGNLWTLSSYRRTPHFPMAKKCQSARQSSGQWETVWSP